MNPYLCPPEQPERDFIAALKARGFKKPTAEDGKRKYDSTILPRSTLIKGDVWVGYVEDRAFIFEWGRGWQPFDVVLAEIDRRDDAADGRTGKDRRRPEAKREIILTVQCIAAESNVFNAVLYGVTKEKRREGG